LEPRDYASDIGRRTDIWDRALPLPPIPKTTEADQLDAVSALRASLDQG
jgi:hypothetical protein